MVKDLIYLIMETCILANTFMELLKDKVSISGKMVITILVHFKMEKNRVMVFGVSQKMMRPTFMMGHIKEI